jgi:hypothetical protein
MWAVLWDLAYGCAHAFYCCSAWAICGNDIGNNRSASSHRGCGSVIPIAGAYLSGIAALNESLFSILECDMHVHNTEIIRCNDLDGVADLPVVGGEVHALNGGSVEKICHTH